MRKLFTGTMTATVLAFASMPGWAMPITETGGGFGIFDNATSTSTISIADDRLVESLFITMDISHSWVGDLTMSLTNPLGITADIMVRPGGGSNANPGDGSDLGDWLYPINSVTPASQIGTGLYTFADNALGDFWGAAGAVGPNVKIPEGSYRASDAAGAPVSLNAIFANTDTQGDWTLSIADGATPDQGEVLFWQLSITPVASPGPGPGPGPGIPVPATLALFGIGLAGLGWSRRKQHP